MLLVSLLLVSITNATKEKMLRSKFVIVTPKVDYYKAERICQLNGLELATVTFKNIKNASKALQLVHYKRAWIKSFEGHGEIDIETNSKENFKSKRSLEEEKRNRKEKRNKNRKEKKRLPDVAVSLSAAKKHHPRKPATVEIIPTPSKKSLCKQPILCQKVYYRENKNKQNVKRRKRVKNEKKFSSEPSVTVYETREEKSKENNKNFKGQTDKKKKKWKILSLENISKSLSD